ncbi:RibD family protein [Rubidibacter lacunae]|uniref:RibD family protein n=1 Tax=Rubidibacter lacunae TaxID=582514 RepID=UPI00058D387E|nr:RibD family protein [Rubidibacter lacunae]
MPQYPYITAVIAVSADGKIADRERAPARFSSPADRAHLERQIAAADGVLFGAGTLRAHGTTLPVRTPQLLRERERLGKPLQPVQIACSRSADLAPDLHFFQQPVPRWLLTTVSGAAVWRDRSTAFERVLAVPRADGTGIDWCRALTALADLGLHRIAAIGGGELLAELLACDAIAELWLTICPLLLGGATAPTAIAGVGRIEAMAAQLDLLSVEPCDGEVFLHYRVRSDRDGSDR